MATLAEELLNDFEDTGSEGEDQHSQDNGDTNLVASAQTDNDASHNETGMELDDDEEEVGNADIANRLSGTKADQEAEDAEETKARIEKLQLRKVNDVRSVAGLMKTLAPVLEVSFFFFNMSIISFTSVMLLVYNVRASVNSPDLRRPSNRKSNTIKIYHQQSNPKTKDRLKITLSISSSHNRIHYQHRLTVR